MRFTGAAQEINWQLLVNKGLARSCINPEPETGFSALERPQLVCACSIAEPVLLPRRIPLLDFRSGPGC